MTEQERQRLEDVITITDVADLDPLERLNAIRDIVEDILAHNGSDL